MPFEHRPDGSLRLNMEQPLYQVIVVILVCFGIGFMFLYGAATNVATEVVVKGYDTGWNIPVIAWRIGFVAGAVVALGAGFFILLGLVRGGTPHVRLEKSRLVVAGRGMVSDRALRWDEIVGIKRFRIMHGDAITVKAKSGKTIQLSEHVFPHGNDFTVLCGQIESRVRQAQA
ncbi:hypothetical protein [Croceicoccus naphthovorans]|uniref:Uncharacterized protein n=1 Tax=Croceicoccus naphthovorans TaxID=1348774 RepID=A0A0G3XIN0_9SPHN|nr:hypothetical protein [Croceicoccus naphthovorans]AKM10474.1 hypothetical protein AB433_11680 [Croceicoccus naphthovorans]MBB3988648.1 hypothetical protein [Croceicoccus naphthovorans]